MFFALFLENLQHSRRQILVCDRLVLFQLLHLHIQFLYVVVLLFYSGKSQSLPLFLFVLIEQKTVQVNNRILACPFVVYFSLLYLAYLFECRFKSFLLHLPKPYARLSFKHFHQFLNWLVHFLDTILHNNDYDFVWVDTFFVELGDVLANAQKSVIHHGAILVVHTDANGHFHIATTFHLDEEVVAIVVPAVVEVIIIFFDQFGLLISFFFKRIDLLGRQLGKVLVGQNWCNGSCLELEIILSIYNFESLGQAALVLFQDTFKRFEIHHMIVVSQFDFLEDFLLDLCLRRWMNYQSGNLGIVPVCHHFSIWINLIAEQLKTFSIWAFTQYLINAGLFNW